MDAPNISTLNELSNNQQAKLINERRILLGKINDQIQHNDTMILSKTIELQLMKLKIHKYHKLIQEFATPLTNMRSFQQSMKDWLNTSNTWNPNKTSEIDLPSVPSSKEILQLESTVEEILLSDLASSSKSSSNTNVRQWSTNNNSVSPNGLNDSTTTESTNIVRNSNSLIRPRQRTVNLSKIVETSSEDSSDEGLSSQICNSVKDIQHNTEHNSAAAESRHDISTECDDANHIFPETVTRRVKRVYSRKSKDASVIASPVTKRKKAEKRQSSSTESSTCQEASASSSSENSRKLSDNSSTTSQNESTKSTSEESKSRNIEEEESLTDTSSSTFKDEESVFQELITSLTTIKNKKSSKVAANSSSMSNNESLNNGSRKSARVATKAKNIVKDAESDNNLSANTRAKRHSLQRSTRNINRLALAIETEVSQSTSVIDEADSIIKPKRQVKRPVIESTSGSESDSESSDHGYSMQKKSMKRRNESKHDEEKTTTKGEESMFLESQSSSKSTSKTSRKLSANARVNKHESPQRRSKKDLNEETKTKHIIKEVSSVKKISNSKNQSPGRKSTRNVKRSEQEVRKSKRVNEETDLVKPKRRVVKPIVLELENEWSDAEVESILKTSTLKRKGKVANSNEIRNLSEEYMRCKVVVTPLGNDQLKRLLPPRSSRNQIKSLKEPSTKTKLRR